MNSPGHAGKSRRRPLRHRPLIGWREWVALPQFGVERIKAKVDTGARSSSLHAFDLRLVERADRNYARFRVHPHQHDTRGETEVEVEVVEFRPVRSSTGHVTKRPVVVTNVVMMGELWRVELTLASRDSMGFRMLLGRQAVRGRYIVDPGGSYYGEKIKKDRGPQQP